MFRVNIAEKSMSNAQCACVTFSVSFTAANTNFEAKTIQFILSSSQYHCQFHNSALFLPKNANIFNNHFYRNSFVKRGILMYQKSDFQAFFGRSPQLYFSVLRVLSIGDNAIFLSIQCYDNSVLRTYICLSLTRALFTFYLHEFSFFSFPGFLVSILKMFVRVYFSIKQPKFLSLSSSISLSNLQPRTSFFLLSVLHLLFICFFILRIDGGLLLFLATFPNRRGLLV